MERRNALKLIGCTVVSPALIGCKPRQPMVAVVPQVTEPLIHLGPAIDKHINGGLRRGEIMNLCGPFTCPRSLCVYKNPFVSQLIETFAVSLEKQWDIIVLTKDVETRTKLSRHNILSLDPFNPNGIAPLKAHPSLWRTIISQFDIILSDESYWNRPVSGEDENLLKEVMDDGLLEAIQDPKSGCTFIRRVHAFNSDAFCDYSLTLESSRPALMHKAFVTQHLSGESKDLFIIDTHVLNQTIGRKG